MYEITFISKEENDNSVKESIKNLEGKIISENLMGRRRFTYPINKEEAGFYVSYVIEINPDNFQNLNKTLRLKNSILRYLIVEKKIYPEKPVKVKVEKPKKIEPIIPVEAAKTPDVQIEPEKTETFPEKPVKKPIKTEKAKPVKTEKEIKIPEEVSKVQPDKKQKESPAVKIEKPKKESDEEERLKALEQKLEEILKD